MLQIRVLGALGVFIIDNMAEFSRSWLNTDDALTTDLESIVSHNLFESFVLHFFPIRPLFMVFSPPA